MQWPADPVELTPERFEVEVKRILEVAGCELDSFEACHRPVLEGVDGEYEIDVTVRFEALGVDFLVLVECKHHATPIKREAIQVLHDRMRSVGAQKGILFASNDFQSGAVTYAQTHGIALVRLVDGDSTYETKSYGRQRHKPPPWAENPDYVGWLLRRSASGNLRMSAVSVQNPEYLRAFLLAE